MIQESYKLWKDDEYTYRVHGNFIPNIVSYIHDEDNELRPAMVIVPGGGYHFVSHSEGEIVAKEFYEKGYNSFVVTYTTTLSGEDIPLKFQPLKDLSKAVMYIRKRAEQFRIQPNQLTLCGFSAGGHLCGSLAVHYDAKELVHKGEYEGISNRPDAVILSYPVISSESHVHQGSFKALLGPDATIEELSYMSIEKHVKSDTPPSFIWHTATDEVVPVENSYLYANACKEARVPFEHHVFGNGNHGLSLANEDWATGNYGGEYTMEQFFESLQIAIDHDTELSPPFSQLRNLPEGVSIKDALLQGMNSQLDKRVDKGIALWPELAHNWLHKLFNL
ncbi:alpha/beta hydrolase [Robertmurraya sp. P23]|uniref:alpha/beta hydrolase n=1 Tax=Robertmurraya sp. P23 TaxID=3436931 RepID=UPI003D96E996